MPSHETATDGVGGAGSDEVIRALRGLGATISSCKIWSSLETQDDLREDEPHYGDSLPRYETSVGGCTASGTLIGINEFDPEHPRCETVDFTVTLTFRNQRT